MADAVAGTGAGSGLAVLVVDDDTAIIRTLADILELHGYHPRTAATAREGLISAEHEIPALAVVDLRLPDMDGLELARRLHQLSELTQVVVLTGNASVESAIGALREHSVDYLLKPVNVEHLLRVIDTAGERFHRRSMELALRESEERYRMLFDRNPQPAWVFDRDTLRFLAVNDSAVRGYGYSREEFLAMSIEEIRPPEDVPALRAAALSPASGVPRLWRHRTRSGRLIDVEVVTHDIPFAGRPGRVVLATDITERVREERALERRTAQQGALAEFGERALRGEDVGLLLRDAARTVARQLEVPVAAVIEYRPDAALTAVRAAHGLPDDAIGRQASAALRAAGASSGIAADIPGPLKPFGQLAAHDVVPREFTADDHHFLRGMAHIVGALMERSRTEQMMRQSQRLEAVGRLAGGVAHDFNNMLTAITGYAEMLRISVPETGALREDVDEILKASERAAALTRQLLAFSRQQTVQPRLVNLNDSVRDMENMLRRLIGEHIQMAVLPGSDLELIKADPGQLQQVLLNLCVNARDAMPNGGELTIETSNVELDATGGAQLVAMPGRYVMLAVSDTGHGMDAETKSKIFEPFFTTKGADKGTGLGLPTVFGIAKQSGGEVWVYSEPGQGTTFKVFLPAVTGVAEEETRVVPAAAPPGGAATGTILLAEDEDPVRRLAHRVLAQAGYTVLLASSGPEAERIARAHPGKIDLVVTDLVMPGGGGQDLARRMRETDPALPVLFLSGYTESTLTRNGGLSESDAFLQKPFTNATLVARVRELLERAAARRAPGGGEAA